MFFLRDLKAPAVGNVQTWGLQDLDEEDLEASFERYCQDIQETAAWGGQTELNALANVLQHHIKVYAARLPVVDMGQQYAGDHIMYLVMHLHMAQCCMSGCCYVAWSVFTHLYDLKAVAHAPTAMQMVTTTSRFAIRTDCGQHFVAIVVCMVLGVNHILHFGCRRTYCNESCNCYSGH